MKNNWLNKIEGVSAKVEAHKMALEDMKFRVLLILKGVWVMEQLRVFFERIRNDHRISVTHIGVFSALLQYGMEHNFGITFRVYSYEIMMIAKISSPKTYFKCVHDLNEYGYIDYEPSFKRKVPSQVTIPDRLPD